MYVCVIGPAILFERYYSDPDKQSQKFFACAAYRSRKMCRFYHSLDDELPADKKERYHRAYTEHQSMLQALCVAEAARKSLLIEKASDRSLCENCGVLLVNEQIAGVHSEHRIKQGLEEQELNSPTMLLRPQDDNKGQAVNKQNY